MDISSSYKIGLISKPHGLKGEVTILLDSQLTSDFDSLDTVFILQAGNLVPYFISSASVKGTKAYVKFEEIDTVEAAGKIAKCELYLPKTTRPKAGRGEFYNDEIIGFTVDDAEAGVLGSVTEVIQNNLQRLLCVRHQEKEILIPVEGPFIKSVNKSRKKISVELPEGFLEL